MIDAELAILSIVAEGSIYGTDIQTIITRRGLRIYTNIGVSSMYYVLEKLERQGLIESVRPPHDDSPSRRQYSITPAGFGVLQTSVADLLSSSRDYASGFELGLANLSVLRPSQVRTAFIAYRQELQSRLNLAHERWQALQKANVPLNVDAMLGHHVAMIEAELNWLNTFMTEWEAQATLEERAEETPEPVDIPRMKQVVLPQDADSPHRAKTRLSAEPASDTPPNLATEFHNNAPRHHDPDEDITGNDLS